MRTRARRASISSPWRTWRSSSSRSRRHEARSMRFLPRVTRDTIKALVVAGLFVYPIAIYIAEGYLTPSQLLAGLLLLLAVRVLLAAWIRPAKRLRDLS